MQQNRAARKSFAQLCGPNRPEGPMREKHDPCVSATQREPDAHRQLIAAEWPRTKIVRGDRREMGRETHETPRQPKLGGASECAYPALSVSQSARTSRCAGFRATLRRRYTVREGTARPHGNAESDAAQAYGTPAFPASHPMPPAITSLDACPMNEGRRARSASNLLRHCAEMAS